MPDRDKKNGRIINNYMDMYIIYYKYLDVYPAVLHVHA